MDIGKVYQASFDRVISYEESHNDFFRLFYNKFMGRSQAIRDKFEATDFAKQKSMLKNSLVYMQVFYETGHVGEHMQRIADVHSRSNKDIIAEFYNDWMEALIDTLKECDPKYCTKVERAWRKVLEPGIAFMLSRYEV